MPAHSPCRSETRSTDACGRKLCNAETTSTGVTEFGMLLLLLITAAAAATATITTATAAATSTGATHDDDYCFYHY